MIHAGVVVIKVALAQQGNGDSLSTLGKTFTVMTQGSVTICRTCSLGM